MSLHWLTTAPNPSVPATGHDAGQRGWKLHAVEAAPEATLRDVRFKASACGLRPSYGWGLDAFVEDRCQKCQRGLS